MPTLHCQRPAMATLFEMWLVGHDEEHLVAVGEAALDEIQRIEGLLSRFDPTAEIHRVNRTAAAHPVLVDHELFAVLQDCGYQFHRTDGYFDVVLAPAKTTHAATADPAGSSETAPPFPQAVQLDQDQRTVKFISGNVTLDLGGYGKGYALDSAGRILNRYGVGSAVLHGGTSSILVRGQRENGQPWTVGLGDPFSGEAAAEIAQLPLTDCGVSTSAVLQGGAASSDIIDPQTGRVLRQQAACSVITPTALDAEVLSTALLAMGKAEARGYLESVAGPCAVAWIQQRDGQTVIEWLKGSTHEFQGK